jgi:hypothetical protein
MIFINMKQKQHIVESIDLIKYEKSFRSDKKDKFFYNLKLSDIDDLLLLETEYKLDNLIVGKKVSYVLNDENLVVNLVFV